MGSGNWIVDNLNSALEMWNGRLAEIWQLISTSPESFKGGGVWNVIVNINDGLKAVGYALLVLFFVMGVVKTCGSFTEMKKPEVAFKCFIRFVLAQAAVSWGMELMTGAFRVAQGMVTTIMDSSGLTAMSATTLPDELVSVIEDVGFIDSIPLWAVTLLGSLFIWVLSLVMILTVYSRFFKLLYRNGHRTHPAGQLCGTALQQYRRSLFEKLCRHLSGGLCHRIGLCDLLCLCLVPARHRGRYAGGSHHRMELCG